MYHFNSRKYISYLLCLMLFTSTLFSTGCSRKADVKEAETVAENTSSSTETDNVSVDDADTVSSLFNFNLYDNDKTFTSDDLAVQKNFESYLNRLYTEIYEDNSITVNFLLENPETYGIEKIRSSWTNTEIAELESYTDDVSAELAELETFSYDSLTYEQQLIYDNLKLYLETECSVPDAYLFTSAFSLEGIQSQLPLIFTEYTFLSKEDIDDYLTLLETLYDYIQSNLDYEKYRMEKGYYLSSYSYESAIDQCERFLEQGDDYLCDIFKNKLDTFEGLTDEEIKAYIERNSQAVTNSVIPSYHLMIDSLTAFQEIGTYNKGLCKLEGGTDYYCYLLKSNVGTEKTPEELITLLDEKIEAYQKDLTTLVLKHPSIYNKFDNPEYIYSDPDEILSYLSEMLENDFPKAASAEYTLKDIDDAMADELTVAFYILSPIDNYRSNLIYVNGNRVGDGNDLFPTLAHEGFPGHLYQHNYFWSRNPNYFRSILTFTGYSEGWAEYVECYSYRWSGLDENLAEALRLNTLLSDALPTRIDLGINYEGWSMNDVADYLSQFGLDDEEYVESFYDTVISAPTVFFTYYIGYEELMELKETAEGTLGDLFYIQDFHKFLLEIGPSYFSIINDRLDDWMQKIISQNGNKE